MAAKKVTIKDVAKAAGVSISTVSNALNDVDVLRPDTKQHILEVARSMHYVPNINGKNLKAQEKKIIGLFIASIKGTYYSVLADSIYQACRKNGYELDIFISDRVESMMAGFLGGRVDGAIILHEWVGEEEVKFIEEDGLPTVFMDREKKGKAISSVVFDSFHVGEMAAQYLLELGHKTFGYMSGYEGNYDNIERKKGFEQGLRNAGASLPEENILVGRFERDMAYRSMKEFLESGKPLPDAIFAANDLSAIGTIEALRDGGIAVPEQISILGCDDIDIAQLIHPSLSTVKTSFDVQGTMAVEQLISLIKKEKEGSVEILHGKIFSRESTCIRDQKGRTAFLVSGKTFGFS